MKRLVRDALNIRCIVCPATVHDGLYRSPAQPRRANVIEHRQKGRLAALTLISVLSFSRSIAMGQTTQPDGTANVGRGLRAREAMLEIFRKKDETAVDRYFSEPFIQHDVTVPDGLPGLRTLAAEVAASPDANITIYRTLEDGEFVLLHSKYEGLSGHAGPMIAFDLFRFRGNRIVEHWGGQEPEAPPNPSGRTQVDGPVDVVDRDKTEANRALVRSFKQVITVDLRFDRVEEFIDADHYMQHASKVGDGIGQMKARIAHVVKPGTGPVLQPRRYIADGNFVLALVEAHAKGGPTSNWDLFRVENGKIVEHWDVLAAVPPREQWKNANGPY
jgi:predicted SnoaL-like aldol condensation-catalyzing enzyme